VSLIFLALISGSLFYLARIILEYRVYQLTILPGFDDLQNKIDRVAEHILSETHLLADVKQRVACLRGTREDLVREVEEMDERLRVEKSQSQVLALTLQKKEFRGILARSRAPVLR
jgi:hypothetical protein